MRMYLRTYIYIVYIVINIYIYISILYLYYTIYVGPNFYSSKVKKKLRKSQKKKKSFMIKMKGIECNDSRARDRPLFKYQYKQFIP